MPKQTQSISEKIKITKYYKYDRIKSLSSSHVHNLKESVKTFYSL